MSASETVSRQWDLLMLIPQHPKRVTVQQVMERLPQTEYDVTRRTVQRDLESLSRKFPITCDLDGRTHHWYWMKAAPLLEIPRMTGSIAIAFLLAREYLKPVLPASVLQELRPYFDRAEAVISKTKSQEHVMVADPSMAQLLL